MILHLLIASKHGILLLERKIFPWRFQSVATLAHKQITQDTRSSNTVSHNPEHTVDQGVNYKTAYEVF